MTMILSCNLGTHMKHRQLLKLGQLYCLLLIFSASLFCVRWGSRRQQVASHSPAFPTVLWLSPLTTMQATPTPPPSITQPYGLRVSPSPQPMDPALQVLQQGCWDMLTKITPWDWEAVARAMETCLTCSRTLYLTTAQPSVTPAPAALPVVPVMQTRPGGANNATLPLRYPLGNFNVSGFVLSVTWLHSCLSLPLQALNVLAFYLC